MYLFIVNPLAGNGNALLVWHEIEHKLQQNNLIYTALISGSEAETQKFIVQHVESQKIKVVAVIGGDGTTSSVIQSIAGTNIALAIFPAGSGNDSVRMFRLTNDPDKFFKGLLDGRATSIDLIKVNSRFGLTVVGIGIDAEIGYRANRSFYKPILNKLKVGSSAYTIAAILELLTFQPFKVNITIDGNKEKLNKAWLIASGNTTSYGGGLVICPHALPADGLLNITMLYNVGRATVLLRLFPALLRGGPVYRKGVVYKAGKSITIETDRPIQAVLDGDIIASTPLHITIHENSLRLILTT